MKNTIAGVAVALAGIVAAGVLGIPIEPSAVMQSGNVGFWDVLGALSNVLAPVVGAIASVVVWIHRRLTDLEEQQDELENSMFGGERNVLNQGVLIEVRNINHQLEEIQETLERVERENEKIRRVQRREHGPVPEEDTFDRDGQ